MYNDSVIVGTLFLNKKILPRVYFFDNRVNSPSYKHKNEASAGVRWPYSPPLPGYIFLLK